MATLGILCFPIGRLFAKINFHTDSFPFRQMKFEKNGRLYEKLKIKKWQNKIPDISRIFPNIVPRKRINTVTLDSCQAARMVNETCVAELTHILLSVLGTALLLIWPGPGGAAVFIIYVLFGNLPFILVQRYNRPRLVRMRETLLRIERRGDSV